MQPTAGEETWRHTEKSCNDNEVSDDEVAIVADRHTVRKEFKGYKNLIIAETMKST